MSNSELVRVSNRQRCPVCGHADWCSIRADGSAAICMRVADGAIRHTKNGGHLHRLGEGGGGSLAPGWRVVTLADRRPTRHDLTNLMARWRTAILPARLSRLAHGLGVSIDALHRLGIGWASDHGAWAFPMTDDAGKVVGIRLRLDSGRKLAVTGGREGLFVAAGLPQRVPMLLVTEGPTDCAAMLDLGFHAIGRPCCTGGTRLIVELVRARSPGQVVILADADEPGQRGAAALASVLVLHVAQVRIIMPPAGVKDARAWKQAGATAADVQAVIDAAAILRLAIARRTCKAQRGGEDGSHV